MSVSEKVKCIEGRNKTLSISRQCELLQLPRSSYYKPRSSLTEGSDNLELMRLIDEEFGLGVSSSQAKHQQAEKGA